MGLRVTTDHPDIDAVAQRFLERDPVRHTVLGTMRDMLGPGAWAAEDGDRLAIRSDTALPVQVAGEWSGAQLDELAGALTALGDVAALVGHAATVRGLQRRLGRPAIRTTEERLFRCDALVAPQHVDGVAELAARGHRDLLLGWVQDFMDEAGAHFSSATDFADRAVAGGCWLWRSDAGELVSMAARRPVHAGSARVGPVYTPAEARGHGYGSAVTAAATRDVLADGAVPVLFTDLANPTSNKIYQQLGYLAVEDRSLLHLR